MAITTITITIEQEAHDGDLVAQHDNAAMLRDALVRVSDAVEEFYPGNMSASSTISTPELAANPPPGWRF